MILSRIMCFCRLLSNFRHRSSNQTRVRYHNTTPRDTTPTDAEVERLNYFHSTHMSTRRYGVMYPRADISQRDDSVSRIPESILTEDLNTHSERCAACHVFVKYIWMNYFSWSLRYEAVGNGEEQNLRHYLVSSIQEQTYLIPRRDLHTEVVSSMCGETSWI